jgi:hypothetical protein
MSWLLSFNLCRGTFFRVPKCNIQPMLILMQFIAVSFGGAVGWGTALQIGKARVRFPMVSIFFSGPRVDSVSNINGDQEYFLGGKCGRCVGLTTLPPSSDRLCWNLGASTPWIPQGLPRAVMGLLYLHFQSKHYTLHTAPNSYMFRQLEYFHIIYAKQPEEECYI